MVLSMLCLFYNSKTQKNRTPVYSELNHHLTHRNLQWNGWFASQKLYFQASCLIMHLWIDADSILCVHATYMGDPVSILPHPVLAFKDICGANLQMEVLSPHIFQIRVCLHTHIHATKSKNTQHLKCIKVK